MSYTAAENYLEFNQLDPDMIKKISSMIYERRREIGISQPTLSALTGVHQSNISRIENGHMPDPGFYQLARLLVGLKVRIKFEAIM